MRVHKIIRNLSGLALIGWLSVACADKRPADSFATLADGFADPASTYRTAPFNVWNGEVTPEEVERTLTELKEAGSGGAFIHPRPGLITEYLGEEWFAGFQTALDWGRQNDLDIWIYDENSYPSGFAGGHVNAQMPESYNQGQGLKLEKCEQLPADVTDYYLILQQQGDQFVDITPNAADYKGKAGSYYLYKKTYYGKSDWYGGFSYVDLLYPGVTEKFIEVTMEGYEKRFKAEFGKQIKGIFSDEPNIQTSGGLRWTPDLFDVFQQKWGYDLKEQLPLLQEEIGDWKHVRHNYFETLLQLFIDRWSKPFHDYCEANNLQWTGHYWEHGWPYLNDGPDNMAMYAWHQLPAIDMLFNQFNEESPVAQFGNVRAVKELRSVANQMGRTRTLSETYGGGGWEDTFKDFKRLGDWEYVLGVNYMNQHLALQTLTGARKYDYPPVFTYHSPWWQDYKLLNDYYGRLSFALSKGEQQNDILVLEPTSTLWCYYSHDQSAEQLSKIGQSFQTFVTQLEQAQVEYDLGSENIIKDHGRVANGQFIVGQSSYKTVVLPPLLEVLNRPTAELLKQFVAEGGKVIDFSQFSLIDGQPDALVAEISQAASVVKEKELTAQVMDQYLREGQPRFEFSGGDLYHQRRQFKDGQLLFLVNSSMDESVEGTVSLAGKSVVQLDAIDGQIYSYPFEAKEGINLSFDLEPAGSLLLFVSEKALNAYPAPAPAACQNKLAAQSAVQVTRLRENALNIDFCDLEIDGVTTRDLHFAQAADQAFKAFGFANGNPWNSSVQYKRNILNRDTFQSGGFKATYRFKVNEAFDYGSMRLVTERPQLFKVKINGTEVKPIPGEWWLDRSFGVYDIAQWVRNGMNEVELSVSPMSIFAEIEPVYVIGDFAVMPEKLGWSISAPVPSLTLGSWKEQHQPFYPWGVAYTKNYVIEDLSRPVAVRLNEWNGTVAEVYVNDQKAGVIGWDPYQLDITSALKKGTNKVEVHVIGSHKNLLGPHYREEKGLASPGHWKNIQSRIPAADYQMLDYGLMEDFDLIQ